MVSLAIYRHKSAIVDHGSYVLLITALGVGCRSLQTSEGGNFIPVLVMRGPMHLNGAPVIAGAVMVAKVKYSLMGRLQDP